MRCVVVACLVVYRLTEDGGGEDERNDLSGRERGSSSTRGAEGRNRESLSQPSYLIAFASLWVLAARWNTIEARTIYVHVQDRACKPVLVPCTNAIRRLGNTGIPYQRWDHRQDWQVLCRHRPIRKENRTAEQGYIYIYIPGEQRREERLYCTKMIRLLRLRTTTRIHPVFYEEIVSIFLYRFTYGPLFSTCWHCSLSIGFTTRARAMLPDR